MPNAHTLIPDCDCGCPTLHGKGDSADMIKVIDFAMLWP